MLVSFVFSKLSVASLSSFQLRVLRIPTCVAILFFFEAVVTLSFFKFQFFAFVSKLCNFSQFHGKAICFFIGCR